MSKHLLNEKWIWSLNEVFVDMEIILENIVLCSFFNQYFTMNDTSTTAKIKHKFPLNNISKNMISDGNSTDVDEVGLHNSSDQSSHEEQTFYAKLSCYKARLEFSEKAMLSLEYYQKIIFC